MSNETQINLTIQNGAVTELNNKLNGNATEINQIGAVSSKSIIQGTLLCGKYEVKEKLDVLTGEADLFLCSFNGDNYVAKVYRRKVAIKTDVVKMLKQIKSDYVAKLYDTGIIDGRTFEILPYYKNGSLQGKKFTFEELKDNIVPSINEGLKALHEKGMIHKDLKPSNIMLLDDGKNVAIIDFGISSVREEGNTVLLTKTGMTPEYSAPETFRNLYLEESDYYSFGVTLFELFCGYTPYANMTSEEVEQYVSVQKMPMPNSIPRELADFINALTYYDITNRKNKDNPNRRWTYNEVKSWYRGKKQIIPGEGIGNISIGNMPPYTFKNMRYTDLSLLVKALAENWNDGKRELFRGNLSSFFKGFDTKITEQCLEAEEQAKISNGKDDTIFWELIYKLIPDLKTFYWKGVSFESLPAFGRDMLERLWKQDKSFYVIYESILTEKLLSQYVKMVAPTNLDLLKAVDSIEMIQKLEENSSVKSYYNMAYLLSGQRICCIDGVQFRTVGELADYLKELLNKSYETFQAFCHKIVDFNGNLDCQLECWLISLGKRNEIQKWRERLSQ